MNSQRRFGHKVWSPHRHTNTVLAFMSVMRMSNHQWQWEDSHENADCWILNGAYFLQEADSMQVQQLYESSLHKPYVAYIAKEFSGLKCRDWSLFKLPVAWNLVLRWANSITSSKDIGEKLISELKSNSPVTSSTWRGHYVGLRGWPNMARYTGEMQLTIACSRLLITPASFEEIVTWGVKPEVLENFLNDAEKNGQLIVKNSAQSGAMQATSTTTSSKISNPSSPAGNNGSSAGLLKRLMGRFMTR